MALPATAPSAKTSESRVSRPKPGRTLKTSPGATTPSVSVIPGTLLAGQRLTAPL